LVALGGIEEARDADHLAVRALYAQQNFIVPRRGFAVEGEDGLGVQDEAVGVESLEDFAGFAYFLVSAHDGVVTRNIQFDAVAPALLGYAAGSLGCGERVLEPVQVGQFGDPEARGDMRRYAVGVELIDAFAGLVCPNPALIQGVPEEHGGEAIAGQVGGDAAGRRQLGLPESTDVENDAITRGEPGQFVHCVYLVQIGVHHAGRVGGAAAVGHFGLEGRADQQTRGLI